MKLKRLLIIALAALVLSVCGCSQKVAPEASPTATLTPAPTVAATPTPEPTEESTPEPTPEPTEEPTPEPTEERGVLEGVKIGIDPGHQAQGNSGQEPVAPGSSETKAKVSSGTEGVATGIEEHAVNLAVALKLRALLEDEGAIVTMTRESADVDISNVERAQLFNDEEVRLAVRLHCNGIDDSSTRGAFMLIPEDNPFQEKCELAAQKIIDAYCEQTGIANKGITVRGDQTGFNWCERPVVNIEMGHMSNADEDRLLTDPDFQTDMATGIYYGIYNYFDAIDN